MSSSEAEDVKRAYGESGSVSKAQVDDYAKTFEMWSLARLMVDRNLSMGRHKGGCLTVQWFVPALAPTTAISTSKS